MSSDGFFARVGRMADGFEKLLGDTAVWAYRKPWHSLAIAAVLTGFFAVGTTRLKLNADLSELLPTTFPSVRAVKELEARFGGIGYVTIIGEDADPAQLKQFAEDITPMLEKLPDFRYVEYKRETKFFEEHALYFMSLEDLEDLYGRMKEREDYEKRKANPLYMDLEDEGPPELSFDDLTNKYQKPGGSTSWMASQLGEPFYLNTQKRMVVILAKPARVALNLQASQEIVGSAETLLRSIDLKKYGPNFHSSRGRRRHLQEEGRPASAHHQGPRLVEHRFAGAHPRLLGLPLPAHHRGRPGHGAARRRHALVVWLCRLGLRHLEHLDRLRRRHLERYGHRERHPLSRTLRDRVVDHRRPRRQYS